MEDTAFTLLKKVSNMCNQKSNSCVMVRLQMLCLYSMFRKFKDMICKNLMEFYFSIFKKVYLLNHSVLLCKVYVNFENKFMTSVGEKAFKLYLLLNTELLP